MSEWSTKWQMLFNADGCVEVKSAKDLGVAIGCTSDSSLQCSKAVSTANKVLCVIKITYVYKSQSNII